MNRVRYVVEVESSQIPPFFVPGSWTNVSGWGGSGAREFETLADAKAHLKRVQQDMFDAERDDTKSRIRRITTTRRSR